MRQSDENQRVVVGLTRKKLIELMEMGVLCGADLHTSDSETKALIHQACLQSCLNKVCADCEMSDLCGTEPQCGSCSVESNSSQVIQFTPT